MPASQRTVQVCLFIMAAIALFGGVLQMSLGQPDTTPRLDNVHRFLAGIYLGCGLIAAWAALTLGGTGRLVSMAKVGLPEPHALWIAYVASEFILPLIIVVAHRARANG